MAYETEAEWKAAQPDLTKITNPMEQRVALESWQTARPGYVNPMDFNNYESYAGAAGIQSGKDAGNDLTNRANFYGMTIENYQNALSGDPTKPMGGNQAVYGSQLLSPLEQRAAEAARGQGIASTTLSPEMQALAQKYPNYFVDYAKQNPDVFNAASQRFQNYLTTTYPGTLEYESVLSGPMQFSPTGVKYPEIKDTASMYILDPRTKQYVKNPNYRSPIRKADGGLMSLAGHMASKGRNGDSMLVHMTPGEVHGLQALAMKHGGSLTINPDTGLPEAGFLSSILPMLAGFALAPLTAGTSLAFLGATPMAAAMTVGGITGLATGSLKKGLMAGLGAYGGAGLQAGLAGAGADALTREALSVEGALPSLENITQVTGEGYGGSAANYSDQVNSAVKAARDTASGMPTSDLLSAGAKAAGADPMGFAKQNLLPLGAAAAPIMADMMVPTTTKMAPVQSPGTIRQKIWDGRQFVDVGPVAADKFGNKSFSDIFRGYNNGGIVALAEGGDVKHFAIGDLVKADIDAAYAAGDYGRVNELAQANKITAADVADTYKGFDTSGLAGLGINLFTPPAAQAAPVVQAATPTYTSYTPEEISSYLRTNPTVDIAAATKQFNADPNIVNQYIAKIDDPFRDATLDTRGSGTFGIFNNMFTQGIDPNELRAANIALDPAYATKGWTADKITNAYNLTKGANELSAVKQGKTTDTDWAKLMVGNGTWDKPQYSVNDMAQVSGLSINEVNARYELEKLKAKAAVVTPPVVPPVVKPPVVTSSPIINATQNTGTNVTVPTDLYTAPASSLPVGVSGNTGPSQIGGGATVNPNGTITTSPRIPGIPVGGFTGITSLRDAYTKGGGSLGYTSPTFDKIEDFNAKYVDKRLTGDSKAAYDFLTGKAGAKYPTKSSVDGQIAVPYDEAVLGYPKRGNLPYIYNKATGKMDPNPDYVAPGRDAEGNVTYTMSLNDIKKSLTDTPLSGQALYDWAKSNNLSAQQIADATGRTLSSVYADFRAGSKSKAAADKKKTDDDAAAAAANSQLDSSSTGGEAAGGLQQAYAMGGATGYALGGLGTLGGYSDGGRLLKGPGDGVSDSIPATIGRKQQPARLADGEFVVPARIVSELGNGSTDAGAKKLYAMMDRVQRARGKTTGKNKVAANSRADKYLPA